MLLLLLSNANLEWSHPSQVLWRPGKATVTVVKFLKDKCPDKFLQVLFRHILDVLDVVVIWVGKLC